MTRVGRHFILVPFMQLSCWVTFFFPQKVTVLPPSYFKKKKKIISVVASRKKEIKKCVICP